MASGLPNGEPATGEELEGRLEATINIRIGEAKNLPPSHELRHGTRDAYVVTALDQEEIFRTASAEKTLNPFFGEEYNFKVPRDFRRISFYIHDADPFVLSLTKDSRLGKVAISKEVLLSGRASDDRWYPILPIDADSEVQGKIQLAVSVVEKMVEGSETSAIIQQVLSVRVLCARGLSAWGNTGLSDPFCQVQLFNSQGQSASEIKRGLVKRKTLDPNFNETFEFPVESVKNFTDTLCRVNLWHQHFLHSEPIFLGEVIISLASFDPSSLRTHTAWYDLGSRPESLRSASSRPDHGSLRVRVTLSQDCIYPLRQYETLKTMLLDSLEVPDITQSALYLLSEVHKDRSAMGRSLVKIFLKLDRIEDLMRALIEHEVNTTSSDPNTLFRGNSLASKVIDEFMKLIGQSYLQRTLQSCIDEIFEVKRPCEIDASKLQEGDHLDLNMANLLFFIEKILSAITSSARSCPRLMSTVFAILKETAIRKFPEQRETVQFSAVSGFVFLRFFAPAILNPKLFHLRPEYPTPVVARTLTLISKSIQNLGNIGARSRLSASLTRKEDFMAPLNAQLLDSSHIKEVTEYLAAVSNPRQGLECQLEDTVYREGPLVKRSQGRKRGPKNWRKRHFCLTADGLTYSKSKADAPLCIIPAYDLLAVERVDDTAFGLRFMFQLVQPERILYMQAKNSVDLMEWLAALAKACSHTHRESNLYHSGAFLNGSWTCCGGPTDQPSGGCKPVSLAVWMLGKREDVDLERELHKIYKMFLEGQEKLLKLKDEASVQAREKGELRDGMPLPRRLAIVFELLMFVKNLELTCNSHIASKAGRLGTKDYPYRCQIGEAHVIR